MVIALGTIAPFALAGLADRRQRAQSARRLTSGVQAGAAAVSGGAVWQTVAEAPHGGGCGVVVGGAFAITLMLFLLWHPSCSV